MNHDIFDCSWQFPGTCVTYGASQAGKSTIVLSLLANRNKLFPGIVIKEIVYVYTSYQPKFDNIKKTDPAIKFVSNYKDISIDIRDSILVFDDYQLVFQSDKSARTFIVDVFQRLAHHNNLFCFCILQTIHNNNLRALALNSTYQIYFPSIRDGLQISFLNREYFPQNKNFLPEVAREVVKSANNFMLIDCSRKCIDRLRVRNFILPSKESKIFIPKDGETSC